MVAMQRRFVLKINVFVSMFMFFCVCQGQKECVRFKTDTDTVYAEPNSTVTVDFTIEQRCYPKTVVVDFISAVVQRETPPHAQICHILYKNGSCLQSDNCGCNPGGFSVSRTVGDVGKESWMITGYGTEGEKQAGLAVNIFVGGTSTVPPETTETTSDMSSDSSVTAKADEPVSVEFRFIAAIVLALVISPAVVVIVVLAVFNFRRRHVSGQFNLRSVELEMAEMYSQSNPDIHHYMGLPPNRHAPTHDEDDEGGDEGGDEENQSYIEIADSESRPESTNYSVPRCHRLETHEL